jgi:hypothetical protein
MIFLAGWQGQFGSPQSEALLIDDSTMFDEVYLERNKYLEL